MFKNKTSDELTGAQKTTAMQNTPKFFDYVTVKVKRADAERGHPTYETTLTIVQTKKDYARLPKYETESGYAGVLETRYEPYSVTREFKTYRSLSERITQSQKT